jgi:predicted MFS family arabinose efflux permease
MFGVEILVPLFFFGSISTIIITLSFYKSRRIERTSLIAAGKDASIFNEGEKKPAIHTALKYGIFMIGLAIGVFLGDVLAKTTSLDEPVAYVSMILIFGGLSLLLYYYLQKRIEGESGQ